MFKSTPKFSRTRNSACSSAPMKIGRKASRCARNSSGVIGILPPACHRRAACGPDPAVKALPGRNTRPNSAACSCANREPRRPEYRPPLRHCAASAPAARRAPGRAGLVGDAIVDDGLLREVGVKLGLPLI